MISHRYVSNFVSMLTATVILVSASASVAGPIAPRWRAGFNAVGAELQSNLRAPSNRNPHYVAYPGPKFPAVYLWDSAFIALIWSHRNPVIAKDVIRSVLYGQQPDGRIPHAISMWGTSEWTQPPLLAWAVERIAPGATDLAYVREVYPALKRYHDWLFQARRHAGGLFFWQHPYESGIDNSPRFGARDESTFVETRTLEAIDLSSYAVMDSEALAKLATSLAGGTQNASERARYTQDAAALSAQARDVAALVRQRLWDPVSGNFYDRNIHTGQLIKISTIASLFTLTAGIASPDQAARLLERISSPTGFNTSIPFPTVERSDRTFEKDCWRGPVWVNTAYLAIQGMKRYGQTPAAQEMASRLVDAVYTSWHYTGKFVEFYDPERYDDRELSRKRGVGLFGFFSGSSNISEFLMHLLVKQFYLGTKPVSHFVGWTGLVNNLVIEETLAPPAGAPPHLGSPRRSMLMREPVIDESIDRVPPETPSPEISLVPPF